jgi:recombination protein RecR
MREKLPALAQLLKQLQQLPYMASRHIYRVAHHFLEMDPERLEQFCTTLRQAQAQLVKCSTCWSWKQVTDSCMFCSSPQRNARVICVVATWYDLWAVERTEGYKGVYHVLGGLICPLEGIGPDALTIDSLVQRAQTCDEIILALNQTPEGEATAAFIGRKLQNSPCTLTCLARGVPVGSSLEMLDRLTLHKALDERRPF